MAVRKRHQVTLARICRLSTWLGAAVVVIFASPIHAADRANLVVLDALKPQLRNVSVPLGTPVRVGTLVITMRNCVNGKDGPVVYLDIEGPKGIAKTEKSGVKPLFSGWMFARTRSVNGLAHPRYDVWLKTCST